MLIDTELVIVSRPFLVDRDRDDYYFLSKLLGKPSTHGFTWVLPIPTQDHRVFT